MAPQPETRDTLALPRRCIRTSANSPNTRRGTTGPSHTLGLGLGLTRYRICQATHGTIGPSPLYYKALSPSWPRDICDCRRCCRFVAPCTTTTSSPGAIAAHHASCTVAPVAPPTRLDHEAPRAAAAPHPSGECTPCQPRPPDTHCPTGTRCPTDRRRHTHPREQRDYQKHHQHPCRAQHRPPLYDVIRRGSCPFRQWNHQGPLEDGRGR